VKKGLAEVISLKFKVVEGTDSPPVGGKKNYFFVTSDRYM
jgi:hypothetical protein